METCNKPKPDKETQALLDVHAAWLESYQTHCNNGDMFGAGAPPDLSGIYLLGVQLSQAKLSHADLRNAVLDSADLVGADLSYADLTGASLCRANLRCASLNYTDCTRASLYRADLYGSGLVSANFTDADLDHANLNAADLHDTGVIRINGAYEVTLYPGGLLHYGCTCHTLDEWPNEANAAAEFHEPGNAENYVREILAIVELCKAIVNPAKNLGHARKYTL